MRIKDYGIWITVFLAIIAFAVAWGSSQEKISNLEKSQQNIMEFQAELFAFTMDLWKIDPDTRNKWAKEAWKPEIKKNGDTLSYHRWYAIKDLKYIIGYEVRRDTSGYRLWADTIYNYKDE